MGKISLTERLEKATKRLEAMKENEVLQSQGKQPKHNLGNRIGMKEMKAYHAFLKSFGGDTENAPKVGNNIKEMFTSTDIIQMVPRVIEGAMIEAAEPEYLFSNLFTRVDAPASGAVIVVPVIGEIFVKEVGEGEPFQEDAPDNNLIENHRLNIAIKKVGIKVSITEEALTDYSWDIYKITIRKMGQAFGRFREEKCMNEASKHGHVVFDNAIKDQKPEAATTGLDELGQKNDTFSMEDFLDMMLAMITNHHNPTDFFAHPLIWTVFARNAMEGIGMTFGALGGQSVNPSGGTQGSPNFSGLQNDMGPQKFILTPGQMNNRLPFGITMNLTPFVRFDKEKGLFDCYVVDRNAVGVIAQRQDITMDNWTDPERDIQYVKAKERYGVGITDNGLGIMVARNIAAKVSYPKRLPVRVIAE